MEASAPILEMKGISKRFPGVQALAGVDFRLFPGEVHALMGENGAGKSTLIKVLTGVYPADAGQILLAGGEIRPGSPARGAGARDQHRLPGGEPLPEPLGGREHLPRARPDRHLPASTGGRCAARADGAAAAASTSTSTSRPPLADVLHRHPADGRHRALARRMQARILILDEPTSSLDEDEVEHALRASCGGSRRRGWRSSSSPTSWTRSTRSPTGSRCCATASWSASTRWPTCRAWS